MSENSHSHIALDTKKTKRHYVYMSSVTGRFVSKEFAEANPETTFQYAIDRRKDEIVIKSREIEQKSQKT